MSNTSEISLPSNTCANCGKEGSDVTNTCNKCKSVMYCNAACKKKHRKKHKKECERRVAELHDEKLFKQPPPLDDDCPICFIRLPFLGSGKTYMSCCGKTICSGCIHVVKSRATKRQDKLCPFCRTPPARTYEENLKRYEKRMDLNDPIAICNMGLYHVQGNNGLQQNYAKALELFHRAAELGYANSYYSIANIYLRGDGVVDRDEEKAKHYWELAAMEGYSDARHNLGVEEYNDGKLDRALWHYVIAVRDGSARSLKNIKQLYKIGYATKDDYAKALHSYQAYVDEIKSDQRDEAAADGGYKYYDSAI